MTRSLFTAVALAGLVALTGCADLGYYAGNGRNGDYRRAPSDRYDDYGRRGTDSRRVDRDVQAYANELDHYLRISNREERAIRDLLVRRTYDHLDRGGVYPFPRRGSRARSFWNQADRDIERILDRRYYEPYRYYNRYGAQRYQEYYRHRRYDARRGWYDTRYDDGRRDRNRSEERAREHRQDQREADRRQDRREDSRERQEDQRDARRERQEDRRERKDDRRETRQDRRETTSRAVPSRRTSVERARQSREEQRRRDRRRSDNDD